MVCDIKFLNMVKTWVFLVILNRELADHNILETLFVTSTTDTFYVFFTAKTQNNAHDFNLTSVLLLQGHDTSNIGYLVLQENLQISLSYLEKSKNLKLHLHKN